MHLSVQFPELIPEIIQHPKLFHHKCAVITFMSEIFGQLALACKWTSLWRVKLTLDNFIYRLVFSLIQLICFSLFNFRWLVNLAAETENHGSLEC